MSMLHNIIGLAIEGNEQGWMYLSGAVFSIYSRKVLFFQNAYFNHHKFDFDIQDVSVICVYFLSIEIIK